MKLQSTIDRTTKYIHAYRIVAIWLLILGLLGFTLWQSLDISNPKVNQTYLEQQRKQQKDNTTGIVLDETLRSRINNLEQTPVNVEPGNLGTDDPFNP